MYAMLTLIIAHHSQKSTVICEEYRALTENFLFLDFTKGEKTAIMFRLSSRCTGGSMDRASDSGSEGWGFESLPVYQIKERIPRRVSSLLFCATRGKGLEHFNAARMSAACRRLDGGNTLIFSRPSGRKCKRVPSGGCRRESPSGSPLAFTRQLCYPDDKGTGKAGEAHDKRGTIQKPG